MSRSVSLILVPIYPRYLDSTEVGAFGIITAMVLFLQIVTIGGFDSAASRWYFHTPDPLDRQRAFATWAFNQLALSAAFCLVIVVAARPIAAALTGDADRFTSSVRLAGLVLLTSTLPNILYNWYRLARRPAAASVAAVSTATLTVAFTMLAIVGSSMGTAGAFLAQVCAGVLMSVVAVVLMGQALNPLNTTHGLWSEMLVFALPLIPGGVAFWVISVSDRFLLRAQSSVAEAGRYHIVATVATGLALLTYAFQQTWGPIALGMKDEARAHPTYRKALLGYVVLGGGLVVVVAATGTAILAVVGGESYSGLLPALALLTGSVVVMGALGIVTIGATISGSSRPTLEAAAAAALFNVVANLLLIPRYGALGASWATLGAMFVLVCVGLLRSERHLRVHYPLARSAVIAIEYATVAFMLVWLDGRLAGASQVVATGTLLILTATWTALLIRSIQRSDQT